MLKKDKIFSCGASACKNWADKSFNIITLNTIITIFIITIIIIAISLHIQKPGILNACGIFKTDDEAFETLL